MNDKTLARAALVALLFLASGTLAGAQEHVPQPYAPDEFPTWLHDLWRADAVFVGSFPFSLFATLEVYDTYRYVTNGFSPSYAPWPLGSGAGVTYSTTETLWLAVSAISISAVISAIDFILERIHEHSAQH